MLVAFCLVFDQCSSCLISVNHLFLTFLHHNVFRLTFETSTPILIARISLIFFILFRCNFLLVIFLLKLAILLRTLARATLSSLLMHLNLSLWFTISCQQRRSTLLRRRLLKWRLDRLSLDLYRSLHWWCNRHGLLSTRLLRCLQRS